MLLKQENMTGEDLFNVSEEIDHNWGITESEHKQILFQQIQSLIQKE